MIDLLQDKLLRGIHGTDEESRPRLNGTPKPEWPVIKDDYFAKAFLKLYINHPEAFNNRGNAAIRKSEQEKVKEILKDALSKRAETIAQPLPNFDEERINGIRNYQVKRLLIRGFRRFPAKIAAPATDTAPKAEEDAYRKVFYSLDFKDDLNGQSTVSNIILGDNGIGKSSAYNALEMIGLGWLPSIRMRGYANRDDEKDFVRNIGSDESESKIVLETEYKNFVWTPGCENQIVPDAFFCNEYDIHILATEGITQKFLNRQLHLAQFQEALTILGDIKNEVIADTKAIMNLKDEIDKVALECYAYEKVFHNFDSDTELGNAAHNTTALDEEQLKEFLSFIFEKYNDENFTNDLKEKITNIQIAENVKNNNLINFTAQLKSAANQWKQLRDEKHKELEKYRSNWPNVDDRQFLPDLLNTIGKTHTYISLSLRSIYDSVTIYLQTVLTETLSKYFKPDISEVIVGKFDNDLMGVKVKTSHKYFGMDYPRDLEPRHILNNFRFKLFCVALKIGLAICAKEMFRINFPVVIDDMFDSSDFGNRIGINEFIEHIYRAHTILMNKSTCQKAKNSSLQLIIFTQDKVLAESAFEGLVRASDSNARFMRLFSHMAVIHSDNPLKDEWHKETLEGDEKSLVCNLLDTIMPRVRGVAE